MRGGYGRLSRVRGRQSRGELQRLLVSTATPAFLHPRWLRPSSSSKIMNVAGSSTQLSGSSSLDDVLNRITTSDNLSSLNGFLKSFTPKESRETILSSTLGSGQDPLDVLDPQRNTLGYLYILYVLSRTCLATPTNRAPQFRPIELEHDNTAHPRRHRDVLPYI